MKFWRGQIRGKVFSYWISLHPIPENCLIACPFLNAFWGGKNNSHCNDKIPIFRNKYSQKMNIRVSVPVSTFMCLWLIYIFPRSVCLFCWRKYVDRSWDFINRSRLMNVKIGAEAALFPEKEYISGIFVAVRPWLTSLSQTDKEQKGGGRG